MREKYKIFNNDCEIILKDYKDHFQSIYFDPPFNSDREYKLNKNEDTGFNDKWDDNSYYEFIRNKVICLNRVLKPAGSLFFHISSREMFIPMTILNDIFPYVFPIFWKKSRSKNNVKNTLGTCVDVIFWCSKTNKPDFYSVYQPLNEYYLNGSYKYKDGIGKYALGHLVKTAPYATKSADRLYEIKVNGMLFKPQYGWRLSKDDLLNLLKEDKVHIPKKSGSNLYKKIYLHESKGKPATDLWDDIHALAQGGEERIYPTQKPEKLLERIILMSSQPGDFVLDPMCGSGTFGVAALKNGRKPVLIDINKDAVEIAKKRLDNE